MMNVWPTFAATVRRCPDANPERKSAGFPRATQWQEKGKSLT